MLQKSIILLTFLLPFTIGKSNNISISNVSIPTSGINNTNDYVKVEFDITWDNSWRTSIGGGGYAAPYNWDAVWVFIKYRVSGGAWQHAYLNDNGHTAPSGSTIDIGLLTPGSAFNSSTNPGLGAFIYRNANGTGTFSLTDVQLRWNYGANGLSDVTVVDFDVYAIEMVYVPQGSYELGDNNTNTNSSFYRRPNPTGTYPSYTVSTEAAINVGNTENYLYYTSHADRGDASGPIPADFPKGYNAFYCMKYEISQAAYVNFMNTLNRTQQISRTRTNISGTSITNRFVMSNSSSINARNGIRCDAVLHATDPITLYNDFDSDGNYNESNDGQNIACNWLNDEDVLAYLDWAGLRPMTELEYEKTCRGIGNTPIQWEYSWGSTAIASSNYAISNSGQSSEAITTNYDASNGNAICTEIEGSINGPAKVGICATGSSNRVTAGAAYYGACDMGGNVWEIIISVGHSSGRSYTGTHGNGLLNASGDPDVSNWPTSGSSGIGARGGAWNKNQAQMRISDRIYSSTDWSSRDSDVGGRGVRTAP